MDSVGRYEVQAVLGSGAFGVVYLAHDPALDDLVAVKVLAPNWSLDANVRTRFISEARVMRRIRSDYVVRVHDIGETDDRCPYYVMDYARGGTLLDRLNARSGAASLAQRMADGAVVIDALASALRDLHAAGIVHRDIKPSNLVFPQPAVSGRETLITGGERLLLSDFGLAKVLDDGSRLTVSGGTPGYMAPEQAEAGAPIDERADLYAATAVVIYVLTGAAPDRDGAWSDRDLPASIASALARGLRGKPSQRYANAVDWRRDLLAGITSVPVDEATLVNAQARRRNWSRRAVTVVAVASVAAVGYAVTRPGDEFGISGPGTIDVGDPTAYRAELAGKVSSYWLDPNGKRVEGPELTVEGLSPGQLTITLVGADRAGRSSTVSTRIVVEQPELAASIEGPERIKVGRATAYSAKLTGAVEHTWTDWNGTSLTGNPFVVEASTPGQLSFTLTAIDSFGKRASTTKTIVVEA